MRRDFMFLHCQDGHDWKFVGGANCGCEDGACSVSVYECSRCGDCDYGENEESKDLRDRCQATLTPSGMISLDR
jgi:hypothetical protein